MTDLMRVLNDSFGFSSFRSGQEEAIQSALAGHDTLVMLPTGSGKSLCYQLFPYIREGITLIVSPLLSLMQDQVEKLKQSGHQEVTALNSFMTKVEKQYILNHLKQYKWVYLSPEMLQQDYVLKYLKQVKINLFVVDEAHCISHWGMDFRPDYLQLGDYCQELGRPPIMALTATATEEVRQEIKELLTFDPDSSREILTTIDRPEIKLMTEYTEGNKVERTLELADYLQKPGIIYFSSRKLADQMSQLINERLDVAAESYHSHRTSADKVKIQQQFIQNKLQIICATSAFGMGINKADVRFVIHYHMPASPAMYMQEIGRASRDGQPSIAILLYEPGDAQLQSFLKEQNIPDENTIRYFYRNSQSLEVADDPQVHLLEYFKQHGYSVAETIQHFKLRQQQVAHQIDYMKQYISAETCKREILLNYFGATSESSEECCHSCNEDLLGQFKQTTNIAVLHQHQVWPKKKILKRLFNLDEIEYGNMLQ